MLKNTKKLTILDTNILISMDKNPNCCNEIIDALSDSDLYITLFSIYELFHNNCNNLIYVISKMSLLNVRIGKRMIKDKEIIEGLLDYKKKGKESILYYEMKAMVKEILEPLFCIFVHTYIYTFGLFINLNKMCEFKYYIESDGFVKYLKNAVNNIVEIDKNKNQKKLLYDFILSTIKELINRFGTYSETVKQWINSVNDGRELYGIYHTNNTKKSKMLSNEFDKYFQREIEGILINHYNYEFAMYIKMIYDRCFNESLAIDINDFIDGLIVSALDKDYYICTDDSKVKNYVASIGKLIDKNETICSIKRKYDNI